MGGIVKDIGKLFNSDIGRVVTGIATGGMSEVGRFAASQATKRLNLDPDIAAAGGALLGGATAANLGGQAARVGQPVIPTAGVNTEAQVLTVPASASGTMAKTAADKEHAQKDAAQSALDASDAARTKREAELAARTETPQEAADARRRAALSAQRLGQGRRRASQTLTTPSLGGY